MLILFCVIYWATDLYMTRSLKEIVTPIDCGIKAPSSSPATTALTARSREIIPVSVRPAQVIAACALPHL